MLTSDFADWTTNSGHGYSPWWSGEGGVMPATSSDPLNEMMWMMTGKPQPQCSDPRPIWRDTGVNVGAAC